MQETPQKNRTIMSVIAYRYWSAYGLSDSVLDTNFSGMSAV